MTTAIKKLTSDDVEAVIKLDQQLSAASRRGFYEKRLAAASRDPDRFVWLTATHNGKFAGFVSANILSGEFGISGLVAMLDAVGITPDAHHIGLGAMLVETLNGELRNRGVSGIYSELSWTDQDLTSFFERAGYRLSPMIVLIRSADGDRTDERDIDSLSGDALSLARDRLTIRSLRQDDLDTIVAIDRKITGRDRTRYYEAKLAEVLNESGVRVSLVAEEQGMPVGFLMARVDYGEFGRTVPTAILDTVGVAPGFTGVGIGRALMNQLALNLRSLRVETVKTCVRWDDLPLIAFFARAGFERAQKLIVQRSL